MSTNAELPDTRVEELLVHADWLRHLATRLVYDGDPDDLVQETWAAALRTPPRAEGEAAKPWLAEVLRNFLRRRWRSEAAQRRRHAAAETAQPPPAHSPEDLLVRAQLQRQLADLVLVLDEPYRTAILLRYYEGKTGAEIAKQLGIPAGTVRWRLSEGLEKLRVGLDQQHGERKMWRALLAPLCLRSNAAPAAVPVAVGLGFRGPSFAWQLAAAAALLVAVSGFFIWRAVRPSDERRFEVAAARAPLRATTIFNPELPASPTAIAGLVLDPEGRPAGGAIVSLSRGRARRSESVQPVSPAKADEGGRFQFESVPRGTYRATASVVGFKAASSAPFEVAANQRAEITLRLERGGHTLSGRVLDAGGGAIPNARVSARLGFPWSLIVDPKSPPRLFEAVADADGRYSFTLDAREYEVRVFADGYAHFDTTVALNRSVVRDLVLQPAARIYGTLFEAGTRNLVAGATVSLLNQDSRNIGAGVRDVQSDEEGRFGFNEVPLGSYQVFARDSRRNLIGNGPVVTAIPFKTAKPIEVALATGSAVQGSAVDESGKPVAGAIVDLRSGLGEAPTVRNVLTSITDAAGHFFLGGLLPGRHQVTVSSGDTVATQDVAVEADKTARLALTLRPRPSQLAVAGRVFKADGQPAGAVMVRLERAGSAVLITTETDDLGNYRLSGGGEGEGTVCAWHPTLGVGKVAVRGSAQGNSSVDVRLSPGLSIGGVVHFVDGAPAEAISVAVTRQEAGVFYDSTTTDDRGRFLIQSLLPGTYTVSATRKRGPHNVSTYQQRPELKIIRLVDGETKADVALVVRRGGKSIRGVVTRDDGQPAVGAHVIANVETDGRSWKPGGARLEFQAVTAEDGTFALTDLDDAGYTLWAVLPGHPDGEAKGIAVGRSDVRIVIPNTAAIAGVVVRADGSPATSFSVKALPAIEKNSRPEQHSLRSKASMAPALVINDSSGRFEVGELAVGRFDVIARDAGGVAVARVDLASGQRLTDLRLVLQPGVKGVGRVVSVEDGQPIEEAVVSVHGSDRSIAARTDKTGRFEIPHIEPGQFLTFDVRRMAMDRIPETITVTTPAAGETLDFGTIKLLAGDFPGRSRIAGDIGLRIRLFENTPLIRQPSPGSPAALAGLNDGDAIIAVDDRDVRGLGTGAIHYLMLRKPGEAVALTVQTPGAPARTVTLTAVPRAR